MIFMQSLLRIFYLLATISSGYAAYNIQNCNDAQVRNFKNALDDVALLARNAARSLQSALNQRGRIPPQVKIILDAFLTPDADQEIYESVLGKN